MMSIMTMVCLGLIYAWSVFVAPLEAEFGWLRIQTSIIFTVTMSCYSVGNFLTSYILRHWGTKPAFALAALLIFIGIGGASRVATLEGFALTYGVGSGLGVGIAYNAVIDIINHWFPDKQGAASGAVLFGFGCGSMLLGMGASAAMTAFGWRPTLLGISILFAAVLVIAALVMGLPPKDAPFPLSASRKSDTLPADLGPRTIWRYPGFYLYFLWIVMLVGGGLMVVSNAAPIALDFGISAEASALYAGALMVCNGLGRVLFGPWYDRHGYRNTLLLVTGIFAVSGIVLILAYVTGSHVLLVLGFVLLGIPFGAVATINPLYVWDFFGVKHFSFNLSCTSLTTICTSMIGPPIAGMIQTRFGSYRYAMYLIPVFALLGFSLILGMERTKGRIGKDVVHGGVS